MKRFGIITLFNVVVLLLSDICAHSQTIKGTVLDNGFEPIVGATVCVIDSAENVLSSAVTDANGLFSIDNAQSSHLRVSHIAFESKDVMVYDDKPLTICLVEKIENIDEVVVTADLVQRFSDHKEYILSVAERQQYPNALNAIEKLPQIEVRDKSVSLANGKSVKVLINGIPSSAVDLSVLPVKSIKKIDYYTQPPARYSSLDFGAVVNVVTRQDEQGCSIGIDAQNALNNGFCNNTLFFRYNRKKSQFGVLYDMSYREHNDVHTEESLSYYVGEQMHQKEIVSFPTYYTYLQQLLTANFSNSSPDNYTFSTKFSAVGFDCLDRINQNVFTFSKDTLQGVGEDRDGYQKLSVDMYFDKQISDNHLFVANVVATKYNSWYKYKYAEQKLSDTLFSTATNIDNDKYSVIGDLSYEYSFNSARITVGARGTAGMGVDADCADNKTINDDLYLYSGLSGSLSEKFDYNVVAGANMNRFVNVNDEEFQSLKFRPELDISYNFDDYNSLEINYVAETHSPAISELTSSPYSKDSNYIYCGNPNLSPYNEHTFEFGYYFEKKWFGCDVGASFGLSKDKIGVVFEQSGGLLKESFENMESSHGFGADVFIYWYPFKSDLLKLKFYASVNNESNAFQGQSWSHTRKYFSADVIFAYRKFGISAFYQTPREVVNGQLLKSYSGVSACEFSYKPIKDLTVALAVRYPFYKGNKEINKVIGSDLISSNKTQMVEDYANMLYVNLIYNVGWGAGKSAVRQFKYNSDSDTGVLNRK